VNIESNWNSHWEEEAKTDFWQEPADEVRDLAINLDRSQIRDILDLGCGIGRHALLFAEFGFSVTAVDYSEKALAILRQKAAEKQIKVNTIRGSYSEDLFRGESFDLVLANNVLYHGYRESFKNAVHLVYKWLRPGGIFLFTCPTRQDAKYGSGEEMADHTFKPLNSVHPGDIHYFADENDVRDFLSEFTTFSQRVLEHYWDNKGARQFSSSRLVTARK
jgi:tellurite methyltransferase